MVLLSGVAAVALFVGFVRREDRSPTPLIEDDTRRDPRLRWGAAVITALFFGVIGMQFVLTQWIQGPEGYDALAAGLYFVPTAVTTLIFSLLARAGPLRLGYGVTAGIGLGALAIGALVAGGSIVAESLPGVVVAGAVVGVGIGIAAVSGVELIMSSARPERAGLGVGRERDAGRGLGRARHRPPRQRAGRDRAATRGRCRWSRRSPPSLHCGVVFSALVRRSRASRRSSAAPTP